MIFKKIIALIIAIHGYLKAILQEVKTKQSNSTSGKNIVVFGDFMIK